MKNIQADISRAKELLKWEPTIDLENGIKELKKVWNVE
jgi:nucleoside-diphosphate-sugar epimerase